MAGHSHWANIAHKKSLIDNKRGKLWSKLSKAIIVAAGGGSFQPKRPPVAGIDVDLAGRAEKIADDVTVRPDSHALGAYGFRPPLRPGRDEWHRSGAPPGCRGRGPWRAPTMSSCC